MSVVKNPIFLITTLAEYQTVFWLEVGLELRRTGREAAFISFDDRSTMLLRQAGFETFSAKQEELAADQATFDATVARFQMSDLNFWLLHERLTFAISDEQELRRKLLAYLALAERACLTLKQRGHSVTMVQELGGFISVIASFFAARLHGIDNWFLEPAFFRGRMFFLKNSFAALDVGASLPEQVSSEVQAYLTATLQSGQIVVPQKDRHQYTTAFKKIINIKNAKRLSVKVVDKYILRKHQEFGYLGHYVSIHMRMLVNSMRMRKIYTELEQIGPFVYYPLHVPGDMALTLRSSEYLDQVALIAYLARIVPHTHKIVIKEHPAMIGAIDAGKILELLSVYDNVHVLPPSTNNYQVLRAADAIVSVNSKSGAEAALLGKPVFVLGDAFYRGSPLVVPIEKLSTLPGLLKQALLNPSHAGVTDSDKVSRYFELVWSHCFVGELYITDPRNIAQFTDSLIAVTIVD